MRIYRYPRFGRLSDFQVLPPSICSPLLPHSSLLSVRFQSQVSPSHFSFRARCLAHRIVVFPPCQFACDRFWAVHLPDFTFASCCCCNKAAAVQDFGRGKTNIGPGDRKFQAQDQAQDIVPSTPFSLSLPPHQSFTSHPFPTNCCHPPRSFSISSSHNHNLNLKTIAA
jgi:hypothetical protein